MYTLLSVLQAVLSSQDDFNAILLCVGAYPAAGEHVESIGVDRSWKISYISIHMGCIMDRNGI